MSISWPLERLRDVELVSSHRGASTRRVQQFEWMTLVTGSIGVALAASLLSIGAAWISTLREGHCQSQWFLTRQACENWRSWPAGWQWLIYLVLSVGLASVSALLVVWVPSANKSGIPELISYFQGFELVNVMGLRQALTRLLGSALASASGLFVGMEAPLVYVTSAIVASLASWGPLSRAKQRDLALAASAVGISVALNAPIGGVIFAIELFLPPQNIVWRMFVCSGISAVVLQSIVAPSSALGGLVVPETGLFRVNYDRVWHVVEILPFGVMGILGGLFGTVIQRWAQIPYKYAQKWPVASVVAISLVTAALSFLNKVSRLPHTELLANLFAECRSNARDQMLCENRQVGGLVYTLLLALVLFPLSTNLSISAGILFPSLLTGALMGRLMGLGMQSLLERLPKVLSTTFCPDKSQHCITPGVYALVGAGATLTGVTKVTVASVVLMFEITGALSFIVPIMIGVITSKWVADSLGGGKSIKDVWFSPKKYPVLPSSSQVIPDLFASEIMICAGTVYTCREEEVESLTNAPHKSIPVLNNRNEFQYLLYTPSKHREPTLILSPKTPLRLVISAMADLGLRAVVIVKEGQFLGLISRREVVAVLENPAPVVTAADMAEFEIEEPSD